MAWRGNDPAIEFTNIDDLRTYIRSLNYNNWRPSNFVIHNTASPTLYQWWHSVPPAQRMANLKDYYYEQMGWSAGPHFFIDGKSWWCMTPPNVSGVHSPSWNGTMLGFEHVGDYDSESDESGMGAEVMRMGHELSAACCEFFGWNPEALKYHKEDPQTSHDCPGRNMEPKSNYINGVQQYMGDGGEAEQPPMAATRGTVHGLATGDVLNIRASASSSSGIIGTADNGDELIVVGEAWNGQTRWLRIQFGHSAGTGIAIFGWASAQYISMSGEPATPPVSPPAAETVATFSGKMSVFGGPDDTGVAPDEGLAMYSSVDQQPNIFLDFQPNGTTGLARRLNPAAFYVACRWDYAQTPKEHLRTIMATISSEGADGRKRSQLAYIGDWGPNESTGRASDLSPGLAAALGLDTNDICTVTIPLPG